MATAHRGFPGQIGTENSNRQDDSGLDYGVPKLQRVATMKSRGNGKITVPSASGL